MKKIFLLIIFCSQVFCQFWYSSIDNPKKLDVFFLPQKSDIYQETLKSDLENSFNTQICIAMYSFTDVEIASAVVKTHQNGCNVYLIIDPTQAGSTTIDEWLESQGIKVQRKKSSTSFMHDKYVIIGDEILWTGSANFTSVSYKQDNNMLRFNNFNELNQFYKTKFWLLWNK